MKTRCGKTPILAESLYEAPVCGTNNPYAQEKDYHNTRSYEQHDRLHNILLSH
jgi:hypothetical protein